MSKFSETCKKCGTFFNPQTVENCPKCFKAEEKVLPAKFGHFRSLVKQKNVENENLGRIQTTLAEQVKSLWKMIGLLEWRKSELEGHIKSMEGYLIRGSDMVDEFGFEPSDEMPLK